MVRWLLQSPDIQGLVLAHGGQSQAPGWVLVGLCILYLVSSCWQSEIEPRSTWSWCILIVKCVCPGDSGSPLMSRVMSSRSLAAGNKDSLVHCQFLAVQHWVLDFLMHSTRSQGNFGLKVSRGSGLPVGEVVFHAPSQLPWPAAYQY